MLNGSWYYFAYKFAAANLFEKSKKQNHRHFISLTEPTQDCWRTTRTDHQIDKYLKQKFVCRGYLITTNMHIFNISFVYFDDLINNIFNQWKRA